MVTIKTVELEGAVTVYTLPELPGFEARVGAWDPKDAKSKTCLTLNADGAFLPKFAGKELARKTADKFAREWLQQCWDRRAEWIRPAA